MTRWLYEYAAAHPRCANGGKNTHHKHQSEVHTHYTHMIIVTVVTVYSIKGEHLPFKATTLIRIFDSIVDRCDRFDIEKTVSLNHEIFRSMFKWNAKVLEFQMIFSRSLACRLKNTFYVQFFNSRRRSKNYWLEKALNGWHASYHLVCIHFFSFRREEENKTNKEFE